MARGVPETHRKIKRYVNIDIAEREQSQLDRIRAYVFKGGEKVKLNQEDMGKYEKLQVVNRLMTVAMTGSELAEAVCKELGVKITMAYYLIKDAKELFGDITQSSRKGEVYILKEMYLRGVAIAFEKGDIPTYLYGLDCIAKLMGLNSAEIHKINIEQLKMPDIIIDSDLETLRAEMGRISKTIHVEAEDE
jgi:hypothetical protein